MRIVYFSHSYREKDRGSVEYFGRLLRSAGIIPSLDPPSDAVNAAKLERHLNSADGMVAILNSREGGVSQHILFEISLCLRARKPLLAFVEDVLPDDILPGRVLQRRFSRRSLIRQTREHAHAIEILRAYLGESPPPRYQPPCTSRACLVIGAAALPPGEAGELPEALAVRGYRAILSPSVSSVPGREICEDLARASLAIAIMEDLTASSAYLLGAAQFSMVPTVTLTLNPQYCYRDGIPREYQPRLLDCTSDGAAAATIDKELAVFEEDFVELESAEQVEEYASLLLKTSSPGRYSGETRDYIVQELVMGDKYTASQAGAMGPQAHAHHMTFNQVWNQVSGSIDLERLAGELSALRAELKRLAAQPEQDMAVGAIAAAEQAASQKDGPRALEYLARAGQWALDIAGKIGVTVASEALKKALGLK